MTKLEELLQRINRGLELNKAKLNDKKADNMLKNRASHNITLLESFKILADEALIEQNLMTVKCKKWDDLDKKIAEYYPENIDDNEIDDGLIGIGEKAAIAFGYL